MVLSNFRKYTLLSAGAALSSQFSPNHNNLAVVNADTDLDDEPSALGDEQDSLLDDGAAKEDSGSTADSANVVKLHSENFTAELKKTKFVLIKWYAPWCAHCKGMASTYIELADKVNALHSEGKLGEHGSITIAEIDATENADLQSEYEVQGYPTLQWFVNGVKMLDYSGDRTVNDMVEFVTEHSGPALKVYQKRDEIDSMVKDRNHSFGLVVLEGDEKDGGFVDIATSIAESPLTQIATGVVFLNTGSSTDKKLTIYKGTKEVEFTADSTGILADKEKSIQWVKENRRPAFGQINEDNFELYMEAGKDGLFWVCIDPKSVKEDLERFSDGLVLAAKKQKYPFVWLDVAEFEDQAKKELGCTDYPTIVLQKGDLVGDREDSKVDKFIRSFSSDVTPKPLKDFSTDTEAAVNEFFDDIESGKLEPVPEPDELDEMDDEGEDDVDMMPGGEKGEEEDL